MNDIVFWDLIQKSLEGSEGDLDAQKYLLVGSLVELQEEDILDFANTFNKYYCLSYKSDLWAAAYLINGGCSDDGFDYFRAWLISRGKAAFEAATKDADGLAELDDIEEIEEAEFEDILSVGYDAYKLKTGKDDFHSLVKKISYPAIEIDWEEDDEILAEMLPKLSAIFS